MAANFGKQLGDNLNPDTRECCLAAFEFAGYSLLAWVGMQHGQLWIFAGDLNAKAAVERKTNAYL